MPTIDSVTLNISAVCRIRPGYDPVQVQAVVTSTVEALAAGLEPGETLMAARLCAAMMAVEGVDSCRLSQWHRSGERPSLAARVEAGPSEVLRPGLIEIRTEGAP